MMTNEIFLHAIETLEQQDACGHVHIDDEKFYYWEKEFSFSPQYFGLPIFPKSLFRNREGTKSIIGLGVAASFQEIPPHPAPPFTFLGGLPFSKEFYGTEWKDFQNFSFFLPIITIEDQRIIITFRGNSQEDAKKNFLSFLHNTLYQILAQELSSEKKKLHLVKTPQLTKEIPDFHYFKNCLDHFHTQKNGLQKVVMARKKLITLENQSTSDILQNILNNFYLKKRDESYLFLLMPHSECAFVSTSPERLFLKKGEFLQIDSLAGTRPRGKTIKEDDALMLELLNSQKDEVEQNFVTQGIIEDLSPFLEGKPSIQKREILKLKELQHLRNIIKGNLKKNIPPIQILKKLHPTPAVGGFPKEKALNFLKDHEQFDRGLYAAPLGIISHDQHDFLVGIRSGLIKKNKVHLYAGAGIVKDSNPKQEWQEIEDKLRHFENLLH